MGRDIPTLCTSSQLYLFSQARFLSHSELLQMHGYEAKKISWRGLTDDECQRILGNLTAATAYAVALTVCLCALGILEKIPS